MRVRVVTVFHTGKCAQINGSQKTHLTGDVQDLIAIFVKGEAILHDDITVGIDQFHPLERFDGDPHGSFEVFLLDFFVVQTATRKQPNNTKIKFLHD